MQEKLGDHLTNSSSEYSTNKTQFSDQDPDQIMSQIKEYRPQAGKSGRFPRVSNLRDVTPQDWSYKALKRLINNYRCLVGYEDKTFKGNRNINRYEFAAALSACVQRMENSHRERLAKNKEDLDQIQRLQQEFAQELTVVLNKVDNLDQKIAFLEDNQFFI